MKRLYIGVAVAVVFFSVLSTPALAQGGEEDSPSVRRTTDAAYRQNCAEDPIVPPNRDTICQNVNASFGFGSLKACSHAPYDGLPQRSFWDVFNTADKVLYEGNVPRPNVFVQRTFDPIDPVVEALIPEETQVWSGTRDFNPPVGPPGALQGLRVCEGSFRHVNNSADEADANLAPLLWLVYGNLPSDPPGDHLRPLLGHVHGTYGGAADRVEPELVTGNPTVDYLLGGVFWTADFAIDNYLAALEDNAPQAVNNAWHAVWPR